MASHLRICPRATFLPFQRKNHFFVGTALPPQQDDPLEERTRRSGGSSGLRVSNGGDSYLDMWKKAVDRERKAMVFQHVAEKTGRTAGGDAVGGERESSEALERKSYEFQKILEVNKEERDRIQRMQVIDRAAAAIAAARAILKESPPPPNVESNDLFSSAEIDGKLGTLRGGSQNGSSFSFHSGNTDSKIPGPDFWSWTPPISNDSANGSGMLKPANKSSSYPATPNPIMEKERPADALSIPFESKLSETNHNPPLPPLQSFMEVEKTEVSTSSQVTPSFEEERELGVQFLVHAAEAAHALQKVDEALPFGVNLDGSRWWKETGVEQRLDGVVCRWTLTRGVSADGAVEWEEKFWEAADEYNYKELGSEKSGRDSTGNVWREYWKESMSQDNGKVHLEKTADKWGKNGNGDEWQEQWREHYGPSGLAEKWAHKWCTIDPNTPLEAGHAHVWHERWGETYDGQGGSMKYTDKWAERFEGDGWTKWGDKWDENFDPNGHGVKQGETWWQGKHGERWKRTWGEGHNGSGWVHKYGRSSSGEHWDTHAREDTWYERYPHYGFMHCFDNSVQLRQVQKPTEMP